MNGRTLNGGVVLWDAHLRGKFRAIGLQEEKSVGGVAPAT